MTFRDRTHAGQVLAEKLGHYRGHDDVVVLGLPRGGVPVAFQVARELRSPLDVFLVRKLGYPGHEELAMGAIASGGLRVVNEDVVRRLGISSQVIDRVAAQEERELERREREYRGGRPPLAVAQHIAIVIDDGLATGATMRAAALALRQQRPSRLVIAVPVGAAATCAEFRKEVDETVCAIQPADFHAVGAWYEDFSQISDREVKELLAAAAQWASQAAAPRSEL